MGQTVVEKIAEGHMASGPQGRPLRAGDYLAVRPHHLMTHDNTSPVISKFRTIGAARIFDPTQPIFALDHDIQNKSEANLKKYAAIESFAKEHGITFYPAGRGIGHQVMCEQLHVVPGSFVVASDSHSNMYGALGAVGTPVVRTDAAAIWATGELWWQVPPTVQVVLTGSLRPHVTGKDVILALAGRYCHDEVLNVALEFTGPGVASLSMDARMTIANMTTEWGALVGWFPVDAVTLAYVRERRALLGKTGVARVSDAQLASWERTPPAPDDDASYAARISLDLSTLSPQVAGPNAVQIVTPLADVEAKRVVIHKAYLLSCVNSRLEDLAAAAAVLAGKKVAPGVTLYVAAASADVQRQAEERGIWQKLVDAGATILPPSCGPCIGLGQGLLAAGEVGISATNRNFKGRMGAPEALCYLASPEVVAASAVVGYISARQMPDGPALKSDWHKLGTPGVAGDERVAILAGFPAQIRGRLLFLPQDNMNTDGIYGKDYTYRDDMSTEAMAKVVMENYDPTFAGRVRPGDIVVGGYNFGTGSSREQAATALKAAGVPLVVAASLSQTYQRNAFNNGFACVECPELVAALRTAHAAAVTAGERTILAGDIDIDFRAGVLRHAGASYRFPALGEVPQALVVAGGVEALVRARLAI